MKNPKIIFCCFIITAGVVIAACSNPLMNPINDHGSFPQNTGAFSLDISGARGRTILPTGVFTSYTLEFFNAGTTDLAHSTERSSQNYNEPVFLVTGSYDLVVTAFTAPGKPAAQGELKGITITTGETTFGTVPLTALGVSEGEGTFSYSIIFPQGLESASMTIYPLLDDRDEQTVNLLNGAAGAIELASSYYDVVISLTKDHEHRVVTWLETLHIYQNMESRFEHTFTDAHFSNIRYIVTFLYDDDGGSVDAAFFHGEKVEVPVTVPMRPFHSARWLDTVTDEAWDFNTPIIGNITLFARWGVSLSDITDYLDDQTDSGDTSDNPVVLPVSVALTEENWLAILNAIASAGKFVALDLSYSTVSSSTSGGGLRSDGTFDPMGGVPTGQYYIVALFLPGGTLAIIDESPYYISLFVSLISVTAVNCKSIGNFAFFEALNLVEANFPVATSIGNGAFQNCLSMVEANFPLVVNIGSNAFQENTALVEANFPVAISIGDYAFAYCSNLVKVHFPSATSIGGGAFFSTSLVEANFPAATSIGNEAFFSITSLVEASIPSVTSIGNWVFGNWFSTTNALSITLGLNTPTLGNNIFMGVTEKPVTVKVPQGASAAYGPIPMEYTDDETDNWANAFRGRGWDGTDYLSGIVNTGVTLRIEYID